MILPLIAKRLVLVLLVDDAFVVKKLVVVALPAKRKDVVALVEDAFVEK